MSVQDAFDLAASAAVKALLDATAMTTFTILLGGDFALTPRVAAQVAGTRAIAADGGMRHAVTLGIIPELWVGDFDSTPPDLPSAYDLVPMQKFPAAKDKTDGELAVAEALARGADRLILVGAFGGLRTDHAFLHLTLAIQLAESGTSVLLTSGSQEGIPLEQGRQLFDYASGTVFSVIAFGDLAGLTLHGARWPLTDFDMPFGSSRTISNEVAGELVISLDSGRAMLIAHPYPPLGF